MASNSQLTERYVTRVSEAGIVNYVSFTEMSVSKQFGEVAKLLSSVGWTPGHSAEHSTPIILSYVYVELRNLTDICLYICDKNALLNRYIYKSVCVCVCVCVSTGVLISP